MSILRRTYHLAFSLLALLTATGALGVQGSGLRAAPWVTADDGSIDVVAGDFNGDGKQDLAIANKGSNNVTIRLGNGDGTFGPPTNFAVGTKPIVVRAVDLNGDGKLDLVTLNYGASSISVLKGRGDGTFDPALSYAVQNQPGDMAIADLNNDGKPDVVAVNTGSSSYSVLLGNGDTTFQVAANYTTSVTNPLAVALGDLNGDGSMDMAIRFNTQVQVFFGAGSGTFALNGTINVHGCACADSIPTGGISSRIAIGDVSGDGKPDIVTAARGAGNVATISFLVNPGDGNYAGGFTISRRETGFDNTSFITLADIDGDGTLDVLFTKQQAVNLETHVHGPGGWTTRVYALGQADSDLEGTWVGGIAVADFNGDGKPDVAVAIYGNDQSVNNAGGAAILLNSGDGSLIGARSYHYLPQANLEGTPKAIAVADLNNDGKPDVVQVTNAAGATPAVIHLGDGLGGFSSTTLLSFPGSYALRGAIAIADLNGDGKRDIVIANQTGNVIEVYLGNGDGTFQAPTSYSAGTSPQTLLLADLNGDGRLDAVVVNSSPPTAFSVLLGNGSGGFGGAATIPSSPGPTVCCALAVGDANGDGKLDLLAFDGLRLGNGDGSFQAVVPIAFADGTGTTTRMADAAFADLNGDGKLDIVAVTIGTYGVALRVRLGNGDGTFQADTAVPFVPMYPTYSGMVLADFNGDGRLDIAMRGLDPVGGPGSNPPSNGQVMLGRGDGSFQRPLTFLVGQNEVELVAVDLNGDGRKDLVWSNRRHGATVSLNTGAWSQTIEFAVPANRTLDAPPFSVSPRGGPSGNPVAVVSLTPGVCTTGGPNGTTITLTGAGTCSLRATQSAGPQLLAAVPETVSFTVLKGYQTISIGLLPSRAVGASFTPSPTATSGLTVSYTSSTPAVCTVSGATVSLIATGTCTLAFSQAGDANWNAAAPVNGSFTVGAPVNLSVTVAGTGGGTVSTSPSGLSCSSGTCTAPFAANTSVTLAAAAAGGSTFAGWSGAGCTGSGNCVVTMNTAKSVTATFDAPPAVGRGDASGDGKADLFWREVAPGLGLSWWTMNGSVATGSNYHQVGSEWQIADVGDLDGDGKADLVWRRSTDGATYLWTLNGLGFKGFFDLGILNPAQWGLVGTADLDGDGKDDIVWRGIDGTVYVWLMNGGSIKGQGVVSNPGTQWVIADLADMNGDGKADIVFRNANDGGVYIYFMNGLSIASGGFVGIVDPVAWILVAAADFDGDGKADLLWRHSSGDTWVWKMNGASFVSAGGIGNPGAGWSVKAIGDFDGDGKADLVWRHTNGTTYLWKMNGASVSAYQPVLDPGGTWQIVAP